MTESKTNSKYFLAFEFFLSNYFGTKLQQVYKTAIVYFVKVSTRGNQYYNTARTTTIINS